MSEQKSFSVVANKIGYYKNSIRNIGDSFEVDTEQELGHWMSIEGVPYEAPVEVLSDEEIEAKMRAKIKAELEVEMKAEETEEKKAEMKAKMKAELLAEMKADAEAELALQKAINDEESKVSDLI